MDIGVVCVTQSGQKAKARTIQMKKQVGIKYKVRTRE
jgi:hypothetical protein